MENKKKINPFQENRHVYVISDIHGGLHLFKSLLTCRMHNSYLFLLGDFIEKGKDALDTLLFVKEMSKDPHIITLLGNNDVAFLKALEPENIDFFMSRVHKKHSILYQVIQKHQLKGDGYSLQAQINALYSDEIVWLRQQKLFVETDDFIFVHAGIAKDGNVNQTNQDVLLSLDNFYEIGHNNPKTVVCGHYPTAMYDHHNFNNNIIIDQDKRIICVDGGYGATNFGQLNMLEIIKEEHGYRYLTYEEDDFEERKIIQTQVAKGSKRGVCFPHYDIEILEEKEFFSLVQIKHNDEIVYVKNEFMTQFGNQYRTIDDTPNNWLGVVKGDCVRILNDKTAGFALVKKDGIFGWVKYGCIEGYENRK